uniref:Yellow-emperor, isoform D n=1 Tax=Drosophila melanogaster TaxID=7227 RepID=A0A0B4LHY0_DROME|nr:yellow-emperor, isoform D [Drosophila melanogaster]AHN57530.1 yellow-emperor, isoform D [Drosophila melanogaster]|eukprot:NP_001287531.1 yellow-emperor, isoform D [Drosophila melanogaster]
MALRLTTIALLHRAPLLVVPKLKATPPTRTLLLRKNLVPFLDDDPCVFSKKAVMHHWGVLPILFITLVGGILKVGAMIRLALVKDDVFFTKDSAYYMYLETRKGPWYKQKSRKWGGRDEYDMPPGLLLANQGDVSGPSYEKDDGKKNDKFAWIGGGGGQISIEAMYFIDLTLRLPSVRLALRFRIR